MADTKQPEGALPEPAFPKLYYCNKCGTFPEASVHPGCSYFAVCDPTGPKYSEAQMRALMAERDAALERVEFYRAFTQDAQALCATAQEEAAALRQSLWDVYAALGCDTDGDPTPAALVGDLGALVLNAAKDAAKDYREACDAIPPGARQYPLPDSLYPGSKDWLFSDYAGRVEWLHGMYEQAKEELAREGREPLTETCEWHEDEAGLWQMACGGEPWVFGDGDVVENNVRHCVNCGRAVKLAGPVGTSADGETQHG